MIPDIIQNRHQKTPMHHHLTDDAWALLYKEVSVAAGVQTVKALVQRKAGAELGQAGGAVLAAAGCLPPGEQVHDDAQRTD